MNRIFSRSVSFSFIPAVPFSNAGPAENLAGAQVFRLITTRGENEFSQMREK